MARRNERSLIEDLMTAPWWISAILAVISYFGLRFLVPAILQGSTGMFNQALATVASSFAGIVSMVFVFTGFISLIMGAIKKKKKIKAQFVKETCLRVKKAFLILVH